MEWEQDISMFDWFFTPNNTSSKVIAITIGTIKYCYNNPAQSINNSATSFNPIQMNVFNWMNECSVAELIDLVPG